MKSLIRALAVALTLSLVGFVVASALARPPTVTFSPGYDARLAESRQAQAARDYYWRQQNNKRVKRLVPR